MLTAECEARRDAVLGADVGHLDGLDAAVVFRATEGHVIPAAGEHGQGHGELLERLRVATRPANHREIHRTWRIDEQEPGGAADDALGIRGGRTCDSTARGRRRPRDSPVRLRDPRVRRRGGAQAASSVSAAIARTVASSLTLSATAL